MNVIAQQVSDLELIHQYEQGCARSMELLLFRYKDKLYTAIYMLVKDRYLAEDLLQETFLRVIKCIQNGRYAEQGKFLPWTMRMAHNLCMDHFRKVKKRVTISLPDGKDIATLIPDGIQSPASRMEEFQKETSIRKLIEQLPTEQKEVVVLRMYGDLSFKEIAQLTGVSINTALGRMRYALMNLRKEIQNHPHIDLAMIQ